ncbi:hypothetical protein MPTK1_6g01430 [Marchantia polymorpha subsp. ruderalis]|uniref:DNA-directed RNA polymerase n=2 Tax=Marchantia polymorpha TaxID=3197 RepID=A0AAF6BME3_MARPO|nr:hypothetical protein MARPO_0052s0061 [Marchantia polymorpha]BBN13177.1 hypothetical protein Mp_6g01430 [Marchantia polymorpha subsp. ruderalis]|eukprot:PTQ38270.1 hypothetical protein MARPO_0052s0061 [Marchantia polymorpha]
MIMPKPVAKTMRDNDRHVTRRAANRIEDHILRRFELVFAHYDLLLRVRTSSSPPALQDSQEWLVSRQSRGLDSIYDTNFDRPPDLPHPRRRALRPPLMSLRAMPGNRNEQIRAGTGSGAPRAPRRCSGINVRDGISHQMIEEDDIHLEESSLGPGGLTRRTASFQVRDIHASHYGRIIENLIV